VGGLWVLLFCCSLFSVLLPAAPARRCWLPALLPLDLAHMPAKGCFAEPLAKLDAILAQFGGTSAATPAGKAPAATPAPSAAGTEGRRTQLAAQITAVGDEIRAMKKAKATKEEVMAKVEALKGLKAEFLAATGAAYEPPAQPKSDGGGKKKKKKKGDGGGAAPEPEPEDPAVAARLAAKFATIRSIGEECVTEDDLRLLLKKKPDSFRLYDGFEPSGRMHIAQGVFKAINVNKCTSAGGTFCFWVADWFALMNDKMGGDLDKIKDVGQYFVEVWKAAGMDMSSGKVEFRWASDDITKNAGTYWPQMLDIARRFTLARIMKCCTIMGRAEGNLTAAQILYPIMQCTDIFFLRADICQLGVDQRKVNMLAREYCTAAGIKLKPVILSHHMLYGLKAGQAKMSKSDPDSAIFMEDTKADIARKLSKAYCPKAPPATGAVADGEMRLVIDDLQNPCLDYVEHIILSRPGAVFAVPGGASYSDFASVRAAFVEGKLSEEDLKAGLVEAVDALVAPVRNHFRDDKKASALFARVQVRHSRVRVRRRRRHRHPPAHQPIASHRSDQADSCGVVASPVWTHAGVQGAGKGGRRRRSCEKASPSAGPLPGSDERAPGLRAAAALARGLPRGSADGARPRPHCAGRQQGAHPPLRFRCVGRGGGGGGPHKSSLLRRMWVAPVASSPSSAATSLLLPAASWLCTLRRWFCGCPIGVR
jgi:tyrosyl-tRNA synthetase